MKSLLLTVSLFLISVLMVTGQDADGVFQSANSDFESGDFEQATLKYESLVDKGHVSAELYFNLGTSLYRQNQSGKAMLWMRRAMVIDPSMPEALQSVAFLRRHLAYLEFAESSIDQFILSLPSTMGQWIFSVAAWLVLIILALAILVPKVRPIRTGLIVLAVLLSGVSGGGAFLAQYRSERLAIENFATVTSLNAVARTAPAGSAKPVIDLPPGSEVRILQKSGSWYYTEIPGNVRGWIAARSIEPTWPILVPES